MLAQKTCVSTEGCFPQEEPSKQGRLTIPTEPVLQTRSRVRDHRWELDLRLVKWELYLQAQCTQNVWELLTLIPTISNLAASHQVHTKGHSPMKPTGGKQTGRNEFNKINILQFSAAPSIQKTTDGIKEQVQTWKRCTLLYCCFSTPSLTTLIKMKKTSLSVRTLHPQANRPSINQPNCSSPCTTVVFWHFRLLFTTKAQWVRTFLIPQIHWNIEQSNAILEIDECHTYRSSLCMPTLDSCGKAIQLLSRTLISELFLCLEVSQTIFNWYFHTSSSRNSFFPPKR